VGGEDGGWWLRIRGTHSLCRTHSAPLTHSLTHSRTHCAVLQLASCPAPTQLLTHSLTHCHFTLPFPSLPFAVFVRAFGRSFVRSLTVTALSSSISLQSPVITRNIRSFACCLFVRSFLAQRRGRRSVSSAYRVVSWRGEARWRGVWDGRT